MNKTFKKSIMILISGWINIRRVGRDRDCRVRSPPGSINVSYFSIKKIDIIYFGFLSLEKNLLISTFT